MKRLGLVVVLLTSCTSAADSPTTTVAPTTSATAAPATTAPTTTTVPTTTTTAGTTTTTEPLPELLGLELEVVTDQLDQPVHAVAIPGSDRMVVVERVGTVEEMTVDGELGDEPWLDLRDRVNSGGIEQGLLGLAFHPLYADNGRVFAFYYFGEATTRLVEYAADPSTGMVDPSTEEILLSFDKPTVRHNGGMLEFGPDGMLWVSLGEGGAASVHSQDPGTLLATILRLDVDNGDPYAIPPDNPFVEGGGAPEVWAYGLRNPWRFSIDGDWIYIGDVGQEDIEEIDVVGLDAGGTNFGWIRMEGSQCFQRGCDPVEEGLTLPVVEYTHSEGCSVTGGRVYRGTAIPELDGVYFYSDWCGQFLRSFRWTGTEAAEQREWLTGIGQVNGFGSDADGELYVLTYEGRAARIVADRAGG